MGLKLEISDDRKIIVAKPETLGKSFDEYAQRLQIAAEFAEKHDINRFLLDYRECELPLDLGFFRVVVNSALFKDENRWRVAILISPDCGALSITAAAGFAEMFQSLRQDSARFFDYADAVKWLVQLESSEVA